MEKLRVRRITPDAVLPRRASPGSAGYDLYAAHDAEVAPHSWELIRLDLRMIIAEGHYGRIEPRPGMAVKHVHVCGGGVDSDHRGPVAVVLYNLSPSDTYMVRKGDRMAQLILERISTPEVEEIASEAEWEWECNRARGEGGFGSTGK